VCTLSGNKATGAEVREAHDDDVVQRLGLGIARP
jgi:hypothetical protein